MKRWKSLGLSGILCVVMALCGCARTPNGDTETAEEGKRAAKDIVEESVTEGTDHISFAEYFAKGEVENNGSYFVRVGNQVYYRLYADDARWDPMMWGEGYLDRDDPSWDSDLMCYDLDTKTTQKLFMVNGTGKLYATVDGFCISGREGTQDMIFCYSVGDGKRTEIHNGELKAVSEDGRRLVILDYADSSDGMIYPYYSVVEDGKELFGLADEQGNYYEFYGLAGDYVIALQQNAEDDVNRLVSVDREGEITILGEIPQPEYDYVAYGAWSELLQLLEDDDGIYLSFGYYEGSGHFLASQQVVTAIPGKENSLEAVWLDGNEEDSAEEELQIYLTGDGEWETAGQVAGEIGLSEGWCGDLVYFDSPYSAIRLATNYMDEDYVDEQGRHKELLATSAVQDTAFIILGTSVRNEEEDIGWREMYDLLSLDYMAVPIQENGLDEAVDLGHVTAGSDGNASAGSAMDMSGAENAEELYRPILDELLVYLQSGNDEDVSIPLGMRELRNYNGAEEALNLMGYCFVDVNRDGIPELLIGEAQTGYPIMAGYTVDAGEIIQFLESWGRSRYLWLGGKFLYSGSSGIMYSEFGIYSLPVDSVEMVCEDFYFSAPQDDNPDEMAFYHNDSSESDKNISEELDMSEDEFRTLENDLTEQAMRLDFIPFASYASGMAEGAYGGASYESSAVYPVWAEEVLDQLAEYEDITASGLAIENKAVFIADEPVTDFKLLALSYVDYDDATGKILYDISEVYAQDELIPDLPLVAPLSLAGTIPNNGFSYVDSMGEEHRFSINASGMDGSLIVEPID